MPRIKTRIKQGREPGLRGYLIAAAITSALLGLTLALGGCAGSHDDYVAYQRARGWASLLAFMECSSIAIDRDPPPSCEDVRVWGWMHERGY